MNNFVIVKNTDFMLRPGACVKLKIPRQQSSSTPFTMSSAPAMKKLFTDAAAWIMVGLKEDTYATNTITADAENKYH